MSSFFEGGGSLYKHKFQVEEGDIAHQPLLVSESRVIALSCGIKISAVCFFILSQSTHVMDGQTDKITTLKTALASLRRDVKIVQKTRKLVENNVFLSGTFYVDTVY